MMGHCGVDTFRRSQMKQNKKPQGTARAKLETEPLTRRQNPDQSVKQLENVTATTSINMGGQVKVLNGSALHTYV